MKLTLEELLLLDWVTCEHGEAPTETKVQELMTWRNLRARVWQSVLAVPQETWDAVAKSTVVSPNVTIDLSSFEAEQLLAIVPTTFRWGAGDDVGFSLKVKLAEQLWGEEVAQATALDNSVARILRDVGKDNDDAA